MLHPSIEHSPLVPSAVEEFSSGEQLFSAQPWFASLGHGEQRRLLSSFVCRSVSERGRVLLSANARSEGWYAVMSGFVLLRGTRDDYPYPSLGISPGGWFDEGCLLDGGVRTYEAIAIRKTTLLCIPRVTFNHLLDSSIFFANAVLRHLNFRLMQMVSILNAMRSHSTEQRMALVLSPLFWRNGTPSGLTQEELGILAGLSRQSTNRALAALAERKLVTLHLGRVVATDSLGLTEFSGIRNTGGERLELTKVNTPSHIEPRVA